MTDLLVSTSATMTDLLDIDSASVDDVMVHLDNESATVDDNHHVAVEGAPHPFEGDMNPYAAHAKEDDDAASIGDDSMEDLHEKNILPIADEHGHKLSYPGEEDVVKGKKLDEEAKQDAFMPVACGSAGGAGASCVGRADRWVRYRTERLRSTAQP